MEGVAGACVAGVAEGEAQGGMGGTEADEGADAAANSPTRTFSMTLQMVSFVTYIEFGINLSRRSLMGVKVTLSAS